MNCTNGKAYKVYLAGPEVFCPDPVARGKDKHAAIARFNTEVLAQEDFHFVGLYPLDTPIAHYADDTATAMRIFAANVGAMSKADLIVANISRFRGPSADVGTAFEMGYMYALRKPLFAYYNLAETYGTADQRPTTVFDDQHLDSDAHTTYIEKVRKFAAGYLVDRSSVPDRDNYAHAIEDFGLTDNLMLSGALYASERQSYTPAASFWDALQEAATSILATMP